MLSEWLKMVEPRPLWDGLLAALESPPVGREDLADQVRAQQGIPKPSSSSASPVTAALQTGGLLV